MSYELTFDGHELSDLFAVERHATRPLGAWEPTLVDVPGRDGALFAGTRRTPVQLTFDLYAIGGTREERQGAMRTLAGWLAVDSPRQLVLGDEGGLWRLAVPTGDSAQEAFLNADHVAVTFECPDPWLYGEARTATIPSGGSVEVEVGGTAPTWPTIECEATGGTQDSWVVTLDGGPAIYAAIPSGTELEVTADCGARTLMVNREAAMLPPAYDWPQLTPGAHTLTMAQGTGDATVTWRERWW